MTEDADLRQQLIEARDKIKAQLVEIESAAGDNYSGVTPDGRDVYAELQQELQEIEELLSSGAN